jgi:DNA-binding Lrp family transcriptional regulator
MKFDDIDKEIINALSGELAGSMRPYKDIADRLGLGEEEVLERIRGYSDAGLLRRMGAMIAHRVAGVEANGMIVWDIEEGSIEEIGEQLASAPEVTHCYARPWNPQWPYSLYTMVHARTREECERVAARLAEEVGGEDYKLVFSTREFKKISPRYFVK